MQQQRSSRLVDTWEGVHAARAQLPSVGLVGLDVQGVRLGQPGGYATLLQLAVDEHTVYCFDLLLLGGAGVFRALEPLLTSPYVLKLCFDCRVHGGVLWRQFGVCLEPLYDLQVLYTRLFQERGDCFLKSLAHVRLQATPKGHHTHSNKHYKLRRLLATQEDLFQRRPITHDLLNHCCADVGLLVRLYWLWGHARSQDEIIATSMARLQAEEDPSALLDFSLSSPSAA
jgi:exonuclease 3'-5' domain-containing protein 1